jgi:hypothetical protein
VKPKSKLLLVVAAIALPPAILWRHSPGGPEVQSQQLVEELLKETLSPADRGAAVTLAERREAAGELGQELRRAFLSGDPKQMRAEIERLLGMGSAGVDVVMGVLSTGIGTQEEAIGYSVYLQVVARACIAGSSQFEPWTADLLAQGVTATLDKGLMNPSALKMSFESLGAHLEPERLRELLRAAKEVTGTEETAMAVQLPSLDLMEAWAKDMPAQVADVLASEIKGGLEDVNTYGRAIGMLGMREMGRALELAQEVRADPSLGSKAEMHATNLESMLAFSVSRLPVVEQADFLVATKDRPGVALQAIGVLLPEQAAYLKATGAADDLDPTVGLALERRSGGPEALEAGFELLALLPPEAPKRDQLLGEFLRGAERNDPRTEQLVEEKFNTCRDQGGNFWKFLSDYVGTSDLSAAREVLAPWLRRTQGEQSPDRQLLISRLRAQFPGEAWGQ